MRIGISQGSVVGDIVFGQGPITSGLQNLECDLLGPSFPGCAQVQSGTANQFSFSSSVIIVLAAALGLTLLYVAVRR